MCEIIPKVSVIIPVYGVERYIKRCAISLFEQTLDDIEYIFIDDCTKDKSIEILYEVLERYPNRKNQVRIEKMFTNSGQAMVRQRGALMATGEYIIHCDSDDWLDLDAYKKLYEKAIEKNYDIVYCDYYRCVESDLKIINQNNIIDNIDFIKKILGLEMAACFWNKLIKRELYLKYNFYPLKGLNMGEDIATIVPLIYNTNNIGYVSMPLYYYVYNPNSVVNNIREKNIEDIKYVVELLEKIFCKDKEILNEISIYKYRQKSLLLFFSNNKNRNKYSNLWSDLHIKMKDVGFKYWFIEKCNNTNFTHFIGMLLYKICQTIK